MTSDINQSTAQSNLISVIFLHHSTGANLVKDGNVRRLFQQRAPFIAFWDHGYDPNAFPLDLLGFGGYTFPVGRRRESMSFLDPLEGTETKKSRSKFVFTPPLQSHIYGLRDATGQVMPASFHIPNNNTDPVGLAELFSQSVTNPPANALCHILQFDVVIFKSCFPVTAIASDEQLRTYQKYYITIRDVIDRYRDKIFIPMTPPPLRAGMTNAEMSKRARVFANWIVSEDYHEQRPHLKPYDFFGQLATPEIHPQANTLRPEFCRSTPSDSHPNVEANRTVAPHWVSFVIEASKQTAFLTQTPK